MAARTSRIELRTDPERERRIRHAAKLSQTSVSAFVLSAAAERAEEVIAASNTSVVPSAYFDELWAALDAPADANATLRARASAERRVQQK